MMKRLMAGVGMALLSAGASADAVYRYQAIALPTTEFRYEDATIAHPVRVSAVADREGCRFVVSLVGLQRGGANDLAMSGRIDSGDCRGRRIMRGVVLGTARTDGDKATLDRLLEVVVLDDR